MTTAVRILTELSRNYANFIVPVEYTEALRIFTDDPNDPPFERKKPIEKKGPIKVGSSEFELFSYMGISTGRRNAPDPLVDSQFEPYHRHMERAEKRTQMTEREKLATEREKFKMLKEDLLGADWKKVLLGVTAIRDPDCKTELEEKKGKTIAEINAYLNRFVEAREREKKLRAKQKNQTEDPGVDDFSSSDEECTGTGKTTAYRYKYVYDLPGKEVIAESEPEELSEPMHKRKSSEIKRDSKKVKTASGGTFSSKPSLPKKPFVSFFTNPKHRLKFDQLLKRPHRTAQAFGRPVPTMKKHDFELPADLNPVKE